MKRLILFATCLILCIVSSAAFAQDVDLSSMSYEDLIALQTQVVKEITSRAEWKEVTVPAGVYEIGVDIPAGHWTITYPGDIASIVTYGKELNDSKTDIYDYDTMQFLTGENKSFSIDMKEGYHIVIQSAPVVFTPYIRPTLGF